MIASRNILGLVAAALVLGALIGCAGGGQNRPPQTVGRVSINGGITNGIGTSAEDVPASPVEQRVDLNINGSTLQDVTLAPNATAAPAGSKFAVFPADVPIIENLQRGNPLTRAPGELIINGEVIEGVTVDDQGRLSAPLALANGSYVADINGPWEIRQGDRKLTVGQFTVWFFVNKNGISSFPTDITGELPSNGGSTADGLSFVSFTVAEEFAFSKATLTIVKDMGALQKSIQLDGTTGTFNDLRDNGNAEIPAHGVDGVYLSMD